MGASMEGYGKSGACTVDRLLSAGKSRKMRNLYFSCSARIIFL